MSKSCVYCGRASALTCEHVVPNFIYKRNPLGKFGYNPKASKLLTWEAKLRDVCMRCNNQNLSNLDSYLNHIYEVNHIDVMITNEDVVPFRYDFPLLARVLLKLSYNCLRFKGTDIEWVKPFISYILRGEDYPDHLGMKLGIEVVRSHRITDEERKYLNGEAKGWVYLPPHVIRFGQIGGSASDGLICRYVFLKNYCFFIVIFQNLIHGQEFDRKLSQFSGALPDVTFLDPEKDMVEVSISSTDALDRYTDSAMVIADKWAEYLSRNS